MKKIIYTISISITSFFEDYLIAALLITAVGAVLMILGILISAKLKGKSAKFALKENSAVLFSALFTLFYFALIFNSTVFNRLSLPRYDPFSSILSGWVIEDQIFYYDFSPLLNVLMFLPLCTVLFIFIKWALRKTITFKALVFVSSITGFISSCLIELLQIILKVGTIQIADIFYNTLGGVLSVVIFILLRKIYNCAAFKNTEAKIKSKIKEHNKRRV